MGFPASYLQRDIFKHRSIFFIIITPIFKYHYLEDCVLGLMPSSC
jgi:hypothetical protein